MGMSIPVARALAERVLYQINSGERVLEAAGENSGAVFGDPAAVLSVRGNVSDAAWTNHLWLLDALASGAIHAELSGGLKRPRPSSVPEAVQFLAPRDSDTSVEALAHLKLVNTALAAAVEGLSDEELDRPVEVAFYGRKSLREL